MYLVDTCVLSEARRRSQQALQWFAQVPESLVFVSAITLGEINKGAELVGRRDKVAASSLRRWLDSIRAIYADRILPVDADAALVWGQLMATRPRPIGDCLIAATALVNRKRLVTRNVADFVDTGLEVVNPWAE